MNELERLLAAVPRPEPSRQLDQRVNALLVQEPRSRSGVRWRNALVLSGVAVCAGLIGFYCGQHSIVAPPVNVAMPAQIPAHVPPSEPDPASDNIVTIPLRQDQLASLFVQTGPPERMLGRGPVKIEVSASPGP